MIAKCGEVRVWHWAHRAGHACDAWKENESRWHRDWKNQFPEDWQEILHRADDGERHIADVKTRDGWVLEFQRSPISPTECRSRTEFYEKLVWVVDGTLRGRDAAQFQKVWESGARVGRNSPIRYLKPDGCARLVEWAGGTAHVILDFGDEQHLWWLLPISTPTGCVFVAQYPPRSMFVEAHRRANPEHRHGFDHLASNVIQFIANAAAPVQKPVARRRVRRGHIQLTAAEKRALGNMNPRPQLRSRARRRR